MATRRRKSSAFEMCPIRDVLERVGNRWSLLVLCALAESSTARFNGLRDKIGGLSQKMLAETLRSLQQDGFLARQVFPTNPPRVEYSLTPLGNSLLKPVYEMVRWAKQNRRRVQEARSNYVQPRHQQAQ